MHKQGLSEHMTLAGDMPVVLMFDGPSLGGFVCPATITSSELWKMGQVSANDTVQFKRVTLGEPILACGGRFNFKFSNLNLLKIGFWVER